MTAIPGRLAIDKASGELSGPIEISYNNPWPCANHGTGSGKMMGVVLHTMVGNLPGTESWFNNPASQASAHFGVGQDGTVRQFLPIGKGITSWAQAAGNLQWYSIEEADNGDPSNPLTAAQISATAQLVEFLSRFASFPLQVTNSVDMPGFGVHSMGSVAWGNHPGCPGQVRAAQRDPILSIAKAIRTGVPPATEVHCPKGSWTKVGGVEVQPAVHDVVLLVRQAG